MKGWKQTTIGALPTPTGTESRLPVALTRLAWLLCGLSLGALTAVLRRGGIWELAGLVVVDGLTVVTWTTVTFFSGIVHSYSRRYVAGNRHVDRFFGRCSRSRWS